MKVIQTELTRHDGKATISMITWLPLNPKVKIGTRLTLDNNPHIWCVLKQYAIDEFDNINQLWGLDLPKSQRTEK